MGVEEQVPPVEPRRVRRDDAADQPARRERGRRDHSRPGPPGQQEEHDEDGGRQLDRGGYADPDTRRPALRDAPDIEQDQGQQDQVDLTQEQGLPYRFERHRGGGHPGHPDPRRPVYRQLQDQPAGAGERRHREQVPEHPGHGERQRRGRPEDDGRERRVGEPVTVRQGLVEAAVAQDGVPAPHVDAEIQGIIRGSEHDDRGELQAEHAVYSHGDPLSSGRHP
jgi:hypothetical protein